MSSQNAAQPPEGTGDSDTKPEDNVLELYKLEYTTGVKRHDDIYKSMWTNFSYMAILAGGILTFGKGALPIEFIGALACLPLLFWFWSSFLPLDRYGDQVAQTMAELETSVNRQFFEPSISTTASSTNENVKDKIRKGLFLYTDFESRKKTDQQVENKTEQQVENKTEQQVENKTEWWRGIKRIKSRFNKIRKGIRVIHTVTVFSIFLHLAFLAFLGQGFYKWYKGDYSNNQTETTEKKLESINNTLKGIDKSVNAVEGSINSLKTSYEDNTRRVENADKGVDTKGSTSPTPP